MILLDDVEIDKAYLAYMESDLPPMTDISRGANRAIIQAQLKQVVEWGNEECFEHPYDSELPEEEYNRKRHRCPACWQTLKKEAGL